MTTPITIHGSRFKSKGFVGPSVIHIGPTNGPTNVTDIVIVSDTQITCKAPAKDPAWPQTVGVWITTPYGVGHKSNAFLYGRPHAFRVRSISPNHGIFRGGTEVVITGNVLTGVTDVFWDLFGELTPATFVVDSDTQITAVAPSGVRFAPYGLRLRAPSGDTTVDATFHVNDAIRPGWTYDNDPVCEVDSIDPSSGSWLGGYTVTVRGRGFVDIGLTAIEYQALVGVAVTVVDDNTATFTALGSSAMFFTPYDFDGGNPQGQISIWFSQPGDAHFASLLFQVDKLEMTSLSPSEASLGGGTTITITGKSLDSLTAVHVWDDVNVVDHDVSGSITLIDQYTATFVMPVVASTAGPQLRVQIVGQDPGNGFVEGGGDPIYAIYEHLWTKQIDTLP